MSSAKDVPAARGQIQTTRLRLVLKAAWQMWLCFEGTFYSRVNKSEAVLYLIGLSPVC